LYEGSAEAAQSTEAADALPELKSLKQQLFSPLLALYQGTTLVVPPPVQNNQGFSPCNSNTQG
jgi:hypothetical protein